MAKSDEGTDTSTREELVSQLYSVRDLEALEKFADTLDVSKPFPAALAYACQSQLSKRERDPDRRFEPGWFLSEDLSAIRYGHLPVIFLGSNDWALLRFHTVNELKARIARLLPRLRAACDAISAPIHFVVVPEKDAIIEKLFGIAAGRDPRDRAIAELFTALEHPGLTTGYDGFLTQVRHCSRPEDYAYPDSHLLARDYLLIFRESLAAFGLASRLPSQAIRLEPDFLYGDLAEKFTPPDKSPVPFLMPCVEGESPEQVAGSTGFESPLRLTKQRFRNPSAPIDARVAIFGDSHSSIFAMRKLTYLFAHAFADCRFSWDPLHLNEEPGPVDADCVLLEISERFLFGMPLARET